MSRYIFKKSIAKNIFVRYNTNVEKENNTYNWKPAVDENLRAGFIELLILHMLCERDMYGYELKKEITERTKGVITFGEGSLYLPLLRMAARGLVTSRKEFVVGKRFRTYYHIEESGRQYAAYGKEQCLAVFDGVTNLLTWEENHGE